MANSDATTVYKILDAIRVYNVSGIFLSKDIMTMLKDNYQSVVVVLKDVGYMCVTVKSRPDESVRIKYDYGSNRYYVDYDGEVSISHATRYPSKCLLHSDTIRHTVNTTEDIEKAQYKAQLMNESGRFVNKGYKHFLIRLGFVVLGVQHTLVPKTSFIGTYDPTFINDKDLVLRDLGRAFGDGWNGPGTMCYDEKARFPLYYRMEDGYVVKFDFIYTGTEIMLDYVCVHPSISPYIDEILDHDPCLSKKYLSVLCGIVDCLSFAEHPNSEERLVRCIRMTSEDCRALFVGSGDSVALDIRTIFGQKFESLRYLKDDCEFTFNHEDGTRVLFSYSWCEGCIVLKFHEEEAQDTPYIPSTRIVPLVFPKEASSSVPEPSKQWYILILEEAWMNADTKDSIVSIKEMLFERTLELHNTKPPEDKEIIISITNIIFKEQSLEETKKDIVRYLLETIL